eukprot:3938505-Rhodomonas_salina.1
MDSCTESMSSLWLSFIRTLGLSRLDEKRDGCARTADTIEVSMREVRARERALEQSMLAAVALARTAVNKGNLAQAAPHMQKARRAKKYLAQIRNMLTSLEAQRDAIETT